MLQHFQLHQWRYHGNRWWVYQRERFPLLKYSVLVAVFCGAAVSYSAALDAQGLPMTTWERSLASRVQVHPVVVFAMASMSVLGFFAQMRIADEFKDADEDARDRPYRPVPRGLVRLRELAWLGFGIGLIQLSVTCLISLNLLPYLLVVWGYFGLMCKEFFVRAWLKRHLLVYSLSHMLIVPLIGLYAVAVQGLNTSPNWLISGSLLPFLLTCYGNGWVLELGRKIRAPEDEEVGVETYSALWGAPWAVWCWWGAALVSAIAALVAMLVLQRGPDDSQFIAPSFTGPMIVGLWAGLFSWITHVTWRFSQHPNRASATSIDRITALWTLALYAGLGWMAWAL